MQKYALMNACLHTYTHAHTMLIHTHTHTHTHTRIIQITHFFPGGKLQRN